MFSRYWLGLSNHFFHRAWEPGYPVVEPRAEQDNPWLVCEVKLRCFVVTWLKSMAPKWMLVGVKSCLYIELGTTFQK